MTVVTKKAALQNQHATAMTAWHQRATLSLRRPLSAQYARTTSGVLVSRTTAVRARLAPTRCVLAVAAPDQLNDPMLLRVPAASLKTLGLYGAQLAKRGVEPLHVVTKIGFDYNVAHPALTFKATRFVEAEEFGEVEAVLLNEAETIGQITGISGGVVSVAEQQAEAPAPKPAPAPKAPAPVAAVEEVVAAPVAAEPSTTKNVDDFDNIGDALDNLDFDD